PAAFALPGSALSTAALVALVYAIIEAPSKGWGNPVILGALGVAVVFGIAFAAWELRNREPLIDLSYLRNPRFSVAALALSLASFALFGAIFALTLYMQFAHGYSALQAGAAMVPIACGLVSGAGSSSMVVEPFGTTNVVAFGLLGFGVLLGTGLAWTPSMPYWPLGIWLFMTAVAMGLVMGPATESVMGAVPEAKAGVASAMNDVTRQVAGALGVAVIGSLISSFYASSVRDGLPALSEPARKTAEDSVGPAPAPAAAPPAGPWPPGV